MTQDCETTDFWSAPLAGDVQRDGRLPKKHLLLPLAVCLDIPSTMDSITNAFYAHEILSPNLRALHRATMGTWQDCLYLLCSQTPSF